MRPNATAQAAKLPGADRLVDGALYFNPLAFSRTPPHSFGNVSRTLPDVRTPGSLNLDALLTKRLLSRGAVAADLRVEVFNATNTVLYAGPETSITSGDFARIRITQVNTPRQIQFGLRVTF